MVQDQGHNDRTTLTNMIDVMYHILQDIIPGTDIGIPIQEVTLDHRADHSQAPRDHSRSPKDSSRSPRDRRHPRSPGVLTPAIIGSQDQFCKRPAAILHGTVDGSYSLFQPHIQCLPESNGRRTSSEQLQSMLELQAGHDIKKCALKRRCPRCRPVDIEALHDVNQMQPWGDPALKYQDR